jgi:hypothetical protein
MVQKASPGIGAAALLVKLRVKRFVSHFSVRENTVFAKRNHARSCAATVRALRGEVGARNLFQKIATARFKNGHLFSLFAKNLVAGDKRDTGKRLI